MNKMNKMNQIVRQFEPCYIGNDWGNYIDIENFKYNLYSMQPQLLVKKTEAHSYHIDIKNNNNNNNNNNKKQEYKAITSLIIKVSSTTFITLFFTYFVCKII